MATIAVGDIHGNLEALGDLLDQLGRVAGRHDTVVFLGDYIDRGPDTRGCVDAILGFRDEAQAQAIRIPDQRLFQSARYGSPQSGV